jgi:hypothetical protein
MLRVFAKTLQEIFLYTGYMQELLPGTSSRKLTNTLAFKVFAKIFVFSSLSVIDTICLEKIENTGYVDA